MDAGLIGAVARPLLVAACAALAAGLLEGLFHALRRQAFGRLTWMSADVYWLSPLSYLYWFAAPAAALALLAALWRRAVPLWLPILVFTTAGSFGVLSLVGRHRISLWAVGVLAVGVGIQAARLARTSPARLFTVTRRSLVWMGAVVAVLGIAVAGGRVLREGFAVARLANPGSDAPSVLLVILDTVRGRNFSLYGYERPTTPNLDGRAAAGVVFENAIATAPWTLPSHASLFTGRWPHELTADWETPLDRTPATLAESLRQQGYRTAGFVANLLYTGREVGLDRGFLRYREHKWSRRQLRLSSSLGQTIESWRTGWWPRYPHYDRKSAAEVSREFLDWVGRLEDGPFFAFLNYFDAHQPYAAPPEFRERFDSGATPLDRYDAAIAYLDHELERVLAELERRGRLDNTIVVVTSDHGEQFGEHGLDEHGNSLYRPLLRVPLVLWGPRVPRGVRVGTFVSLRDLPATLVELTGGQDRFPGSSLVRHWNPDGRVVEGAAPVLSEVSRGIRSAPEDPVSRGPMKSLFVEPFHYIRNGDGRKELYDVAGDPDELDDLAGTAAGRRILQRLDPMLEAVLESDPGTAGTSAQGAARSGRTARGPVPSRGTG